MESATTILFALLWVVPARASPSPKISAESEVTTEGDDPYVLERRLYEALDADFGCARDGAWVSRSDHLYSHGALLDYFGCSGGADHPRRPNTELCYPGGDLHYTAGHFGHLGREVLDATHTTWIEPGERGRVILSVAPADPEPWRRIRPRDVVYDGSKVPFHGIRAVFSPAGLERVVVNTTSWNHWECCRRVQSWTHPRHFVVVVHDVRYVDDVPTESRRTWWTARNRRSPVLQALELAPVVHDDFCPLGSPGCHRVDGGPGDEPGRPP